VSSQNWSKEVLKRRVRFAYGDSLASENRNDGDVPVFGSNGVVGAHDRSITRAPAIIIGRKGSAGRVTWSHVPCFPIDTTYFVDRTQTRENMRWLFYALESLELDKINFDSAVPGLSRELAYSLPLVFPPLHEQERIAAYLDKTCAAIDTAIDKKQKQLETLDALRKSIIHKAVTRGLDDSVELKDSGVEWFDKIPEHWKIDRLKDVLAANKDAIKVGPFGSDLLLGDMEDEGVKVYTQRTVIDRDFDAGIHFISLEKYAAMKAFTVYPRDLLITTRGTIGRCAIMPDTAQLGILHPCLMRVQTNKARLIPEYLSVLIQDCGLVLRQLQMMSAATTIDVIYSDALKRTYLPLPPLEEQRTIIDFIDKKMVEIGELFSLIEGQIATLAAYRKSLIHECVTGKRRITEDDIQRVQQY